MTLLAISVNCLPFILFQQEAEFREGGDPKYSHLNDELHVDISAYAPAPEAYARMANALEGIKKFLVPVSLFINCL